MIYLTLSLPNQNKNAFLLTDYRNVLLGIIRPAESTVSRKISEKEQTTTHLPRSVNHALTSMSCLVIYIHINFVL